MAFCKIKFHKGVEFNFASEGGEMADIGSLAMLAFLFYVRYTK